MKASAQDGKDIRLAHCTEPKLNLEGKKFSSDIER